MHLLSAIVVTICIGTCSGLHFQCPSSFPCISLDLDASFNFTRKANTSSQTSQFDLSKAMVLDSECICYNAKSENEPIITLVLDPTGEERVRFTFATFNERLGDVDGPIESAGVAAPTNIDMGIILDLQPSRHFVNVTDKRTIEIPASKGVNIGEIGPTSYKCSSHQTSMFDQGIYHVIMDMSKMQVQAHDLDAGKYGPAVECAADMTSPKPTHTTQTTHHVTTKTTHHVTTKTTPHTTKTTPHTTKTTHHVTTKTTPHTTKTTPHTTKTSPHTTKTTPHTTKTSPHTTKTTPHTTKTTPHTTKTSPHSTKTTPHTTKTTPHTTKTSPHSTKTTPHTTKTSPHSTKTTPHSTKTTPHTTKTSPHSTKTTHHVTSKTTPHNGTTGTTHHSTPSTPPITPTPIVPKYGLMDPNDKSYCVVMQGNIEFEIPYIRKDNKPSILALLIPRNATLSGSCSFDNGTKQMVVLSFFDGWSFTVGIGVSNKQEGVADRYLMPGAAAVYSWTDVTLDYVLDDHFSQPKEAGKAMTVSAKPTFDTFKSDSLGSYKCISKQTLKMSNVSLDLSDFQYLGFGTSKSEDFPNKDVTECAADAAKTTPIPTTAAPPHNNAGAIVGGIIGGIVGLCLIVALAMYIQKRRRNSNSYDEL